MSLVSTKAFDCNTPAEDFKRNRNHAAHFEVPTARKP
jgi:hypothetical protein